MTIRQGCGKILVKQGEELMIEMYSDAISIGTQKCGFCSHNTCGPCKGMIRNGDGSLYQCPCDCFVTKVEICTHCMTSDQNHLGRPWLCHDRGACADRLKARLAKDKGYQLLNKYFSALGTSGSCLCCGRPTKGGKFLPGHNAKLEKRLDGIKIDHSKNAIR